MFSKKLIIIGCGVLSILSHAKCQSDALGEVQPSSLVHLRGPGYDPLRGSLGQEGPAHVQPILSSEEMISQDYDDFPIDGYRSPRDIDSMESNNNVNVNVNSNSPAKVPWNQPQMYRNNRVPSSQYGPNRRRQHNRMMPPIRLSPNSNFDYSFAHPGGNVRLKQKRSHILDARIVNQQYPSSEEFELSIPNASKTLCYPIIMQAVKYLQRIETNMKKLEENLRIYIVGLQEDNADDNSQ